MDLAGIYHKANILIAQTYGITGVPEKGYVIVTVNNVRYIVYFYKIESGWNIEKVEECLELNSAFLSIITVEANFLCLSSI